VGLIHTRVRRSGRRIMLAIDYPRYGIGQLSRIVESTMEYVAGYKFGLPVLIHHGIRSLAGLVRDYPDTYYLADPKLSDISEVMVLAAEELINAGFHGIVAHAFIGTSGALDALARRVKDLGADLVLQTSMVHSGSIYTIDRVLYEIKNVINAVDPEGLIAPANKAEVIKDFRNSFGWRHVILSPGIMAKGAAPGEALCAGADAEIVGRLVLTSPNPIDALKYVMDRQSEYLRREDTSCVEVPLSE